MVNGFQCYETMNMDTYILIFCIWKEKKITGNLIEIQSTLSNMQSYKQHNTFGYNQWNFLLNFTTLFSHFFLKMTNFIV